MCWVFVRMHWWFCVTTSPEPCKLWTWSLHCTVGHSKDMLKTHNKIARVECSWKQVLFSALILQIQIACCVLQYKFHVFKLYRVQEIRSHKISNAYRTMKHGLPQGLTAPIVMGMSQYLKHFYEPQSLLYPMLQVSCLWREGFKRYSYTSLPMCTKIIKIVYFMGSQVHIWWGCHNTFTYQIKLQSHVHRW